MKFVSWNVNGLRACLKKGFAETFAALDADFFCVQETKMQPGQADFAPEGYTEYIYSADKKGYSGTAVWAKTPALAVRYGLPQDAHNHEGRAITLEYPGFYLVCLYVPNAQNELARIDYRMQWEDDLRRYLQERRARGHRPEKPRPQPRGGGVQRPGARQAERTAGRRVHRYLPPLTPRRHRHVQLVEHAVPRAGAQRGLAHRLLFGQRPAGPAHRACRYFDGYFGQRPLPRDAGTGRGELNCRAGSRPRHSWPVPPVYGLGSVCLAL